MAHDSLKHLSPWITPPFVQSAVLEFMRANPGPLTLMEITTGIGHSRAATNLALQRLHNKHVVDRYKLPMQRHGYSHLLKAVVPGWVTKQCYVYTLNEDAE